MLAFAQCGLGKVFWFVVIAPFASHAAHRTLHRLHSLGVREGALARLGCDGGALAITLVAAVSLWAIGS